MRGVRVKEGDQGGGQRTGEEEEIEEGLWSNGLKDTKFSPG
jgi:hypothetical protein